MEARNDSMRIQTRKIGEINDSRKVRSGRRGEKREM